MADVDMRGYIGAGKDIFRKVSAWALERRAEHPLHVPPAKPCVPCIHIGREKLTFDTPRVINP